MDYKYQLLEQEPGGICISQFSSGTCYVSSEIALKKFEFQCEGVDGTRLKLFFFVNLRTSTFQLKGLHESQRYITRVCNISNVTLTYFPESQ